MTVTTFSEKQMDGVGATSPSFGWEYLVNVDCNRSELALTQPSQRILAVRAKVLVVKLTCEIGLWNIGGIMSYTHQGIKEDIIKILVNIFGIEESAITVNAPLYSVGLDSIAIVELEIIVKKEFGLEQEVLNVKKDDSVDLLQNKIFSLREKHKNV